MNPLTSLARRGLFLFDPEAAHGLSIKALKTGLVPNCPARADKRLAQTVAGIVFPNPIGMAAGYDKNAEVPEALLKIGFGFTEVGTVTPKPQPGNPRPRVFRLTVDRGVINRYGFNNDGHDALRARLEARRRRGGIVGVNVGANKDAADRAADYVAGITRFADLASFFTVNVSSPNTPGLRDLQARAALADLLRRVLAARDEATATVGRKVPLLLKIAPDIDEVQMAEIAEEALSNRVDGLIVSNTTIARDGLKDVDGARETGGLSGRPLFHRSTVVLAKMRKLVGPDLPIVGVGGIDSGETAWAKITAGADLIQLYTGLIYEGPSLVGRILRHLVDEMDRRGMRSISEARGIEVEKWAGQR